LSGLQNGAHPSTLVSPNNFDEHLGPDFAATAGGGGGGGEAAGGDFFFFFGEGAGAGTGAGVGTGAGAGAGTGAGVAFFFLGLLGDGDTPGAAAGKLTLGLGNFCSAGGVELPPQYWHVLHLQ